MTNSRAAACGARIAEAADNYDKRPTPAAAWALAQALAAGRLYRAYTSASTAVFEAVKRHSGEFLHAALQYGLHVDYPSFVDDRLHLAEDDPELWEFHARDLWILHFELQATLEWSAEVIREWSISSGEITSLVGQLREAVQALGERIRDHADLFGAARQLEAGMLADADPSLLTNDFFLLTARDTLAPRPEETTEPTHEEERSSPHETPGQALRAFFETLRAAMLGDLVLPARARADSGAPTSNPGRVVFRISAAHRVERLEADVLVAGSDPDSCEKLVKQGTFFINVRGLPRARDKAAAYLLTSDMIEELANIRAKAGTPCDDPEELLLWAAAEQARKNVDVAKVLLRHPLHRTTVVVPDLPNAAGWADFPAELGPNLGAPLPDSTWVLVVLQPGDV